MCSTSLTKRVYDAETTLYISPVILASQAEDRRGGVPVLVQPHPAFYLDLLASLCKSRDLRLALQPLQ